MTPRRPRIQQLLAGLQHHIYEKQTETALSLLAALAGESILLLGPPGVAKSMVARRMKQAFSHARSFEYLMSRFSTPDELFGPVSIARLKSSDKYERATGGFLPEADIVFLDEIWKAGPAIQNTLLTVMNERLFRNGDTEMRLPLKLLLAASNELPARGEGLEALWDRFLVRVVCRNISDEQTFRRMLCATDEPETAAVDAPITPDEYARWKEEAAALPLSAEVLDAVSLIRRALQRVDIEGAELPRSIYVSDRRWKHIAALLRTSAYAHDREAVCPADLWTAHHCLWNEPDERAAVRDIVLGALFHPALQQLQTLAAEVADARHAADAHSALSQALRRHDHRDDSLLIVGGCCYQLENHGTGHTYIFITDYKALPEYGSRQPQAAGVIEDDPSAKGRRMIRLAQSAGSAATAATGAERVTLSRTDTHIYLNGVAFRMRRKGTPAYSPADGRADLFSAAQTDAPPSAADVYRSARFEERIEDVCGRIEQLHRSLTDNLFVSDDERALISQRVAAMYKDAARCRADISTLLYGND